MPSLRDRVSGIIAGYDSQGWHRTGTAVDRMSCEWLAMQVGRAGGSPATEAFELERVEPGDCYAEIGETRIPGIPAFDGGFTDHEGVAGPLTLSLDTGPILALHLPVAGAAVELDAAREAPGVAAIIVSVIGAEGRPLRNAERFARPYGPPVLQVAPQTWALLQEAAASGADARVVVQAHRVACEAENVVCLVEGRNRGLAPLVVMTPRSGWWECASERGGGIACWLEALRAARSSRPERDICFVATSGHELGHLGLDDFIERRLELPAAAICWVHLGANIGAAEGARLAVRSSDPGLSARAGALLRQSGFRHQVVENPPGPVAGEAANVAAQGGRFVSFIGANQLFHTEQDRWPHAVDLEAVCAAAQAIRRLVSELAGNVAER